MPGLRLTFAQACRLWQIDAPTCETLLEQLVREAFLYKTDDGAYIALSATASPQAKAQLRRQRVPLPPDAVMTGIPHECWLFTRGPQSVRLVREENSTDCRLFVHGPGTEVVTHEFPNLTECVRRQAEIEQKLLAMGYQIAQPSSDRRSAHGIWHGPDHRRDNSNRQSRRSA